jgi:hypothetical protein
LGARIANILSEDDGSGSKRTGDLKAGNGNENPRKRKHKIIIHSSPFLRCVQTSIGISAGLAQTPGVQLYTPRSQIEKPEHVAKSPRTSPTKETPPKLSLATESAPKEQSKKPADQPENIKTSTMRVEAFLGEWLTPDYFEHITPPPNSVLMVAGAKVDLMRTEDYSNLTRPRDVVSAQTQGFPGGWGSPVVPPTAVESEGSLSSLPALAQALPDRDRSSSLSGVAGNGNLKRGRSVTNGSFPLPGDHGLYEPPVPVYAISSSNPIPPGFVAHARDACVDVDSHWDSMRGSPNCGDGGEYGEEWSTMHKRFRKGFQQLVTWYEEHDLPKIRVEKTPVELDGPGSSHDDDDGDGDDDDDEDTDTVLILVSHGAGCNALIGALINQPVLLDVGMASLTMAIRKPTPSNTPVSTPEETPRSQSPTNSGDITVHKQYDVKIIANTDHLRPSNSSTPSSSRQSSASGLPAFRERFGSNAGSIDGTSLSKAARSATTSGNLGMMRRTASIATSGPRKYVQTSVGLWTPPSREEAMEEHEDEKHHEPIKEPERPAVRSSLQQETKVESADHLKEKEEKDTIAPLGLWGTPRPPGEAEMMRELGTKRRWTVTERR